MLAFEMMTGYFATKYSFKKSPYFAKTAALFLNRKYRKIFKKNLFNNYKRPMETT